MASMLANAGYKISILQSETPHGPALTNLGEICLVDNFQSLFFNQTQCAHEDYFRYQLAKVERDRSTVVQFSFHHALFE